SGWDHDAGDDRSVDRLRLDLPRRALRCDRLAGVVRREPLRPPPPRYAGLTPRIPHDLLAGDDPGGRDGDRTGQLRRGRTDVALHGPAPWVGRTGDHGRGRSRDAVLLSRLGLSGLGDLRSLRSGHRLLDTQEGTPGAGVDDAAPGARPVRRRLDRQ